MQPINKKRNLIRLTAAASIAAFLTLGVGFTSANYSGQINVKSTLVAAGSRTVGNGGATGEITIRETGLTLANNAINFADNDAKVLFSSSNGSNNLNLVESEGGLQPGSSVIQELVLSDLLKNVENNDDAEEYDNANHIADVKSDFWLSEIGVNNGKQLPIVDSNAIANALKSLYDQGEIVKAPIMGTFYLQLGDQVFEATTLENLLELVKGHGKFDFNYDSPENIGIKFAFEWGYTNYADTYRTNFGSIALNKWGDEWPIQNVLYNEQIEMLRHSNLTVEKHTYSGTALINPDDEYTDQKIDGDILGADIVKVEITNGDPPLTGYSQQWQWVRALVNKSLSESGKGGNDAYLFVGSEEPVGGASYGIGATTLYYARVNSAKAEEMKKPDLYKSKINDLYSQKEGDNSFARLDVNNAANGDGIHYVYIEPYKVNQDGSSGSDDDYRSVNLYFKEDDSFDNDWRDGLITDGGDQLVDMTIFPSLTFDFKQKH